MLFNPMNFNMYQFMPTGFNFPMMNFPMMNFPMMNFPMMNFPSQNFSPNNFVPQDNLFGFLQNFSTKTTTVTRRVDSKQNPTEFNRHVEQIAANLNCNSNDLLSIMRSESGLNHKAVNENGGATGLIQFMPKTAAGLGTTTEALKNMSAIEQLDYVEKYLSQSKKTAGFSKNQQLTGADLYSLIFLPARANRDILCSNGSKFYTANKGLDIDKDGHISKADLTNRISRFSAVA